MFSFRNHFLSGRLNEAIEPNADLSPNVIAAYCTQCTAEAQEVTVARAVDLKHSPSIIASIALETANLFEKGGKVKALFNKFLLVFLDAALQSLQSNADFDKWRLYFKAKAALYTAYAHAYNGERLLSEDKCGEAVKACREGLASERRIHFYFLSKTFQIMQRQKSSASTTPRPKVLA